MGSLNDKVKGTFNASVGKAKEVAGKFTHNKDLESEGSAQKTMGQGQQALGDLKHKVEKGAQSAGVGIENMGKKIQEKARL